MKNPEKIIQSHHILKANTKGHNDNYFMHKSLIDD